MTASYKPTVYEQIVQDFLSGKEPKFEDYKEELALRGWVEERYFDRYIEDLKYIKSLMDAPDFNLRQAMDNVKKRAVQDGEENGADKLHKKDVLKFSLTDEEKELVLKAEAMGAVKDGEEIEYEGYDKKIVCADYENLPPQTDAFVVFSGHPGSAEPAIEAWLTDFKKTGQPKKLIFLGLYDNQGNTDFSQEGLKYNTGSEVEMYVRYCRDLGVPEEILKECLMTPTDTSTKDNTALLAEIRNKYFDKDKDVSFAMFGYPSYQRRIASEFSFEFNKMEKEGSVAPTSFIMPAVPISHDEHDRFLSYDNLDGIAQDIIVGNCMAHPYRVWAGGRFDSKLGEYPEELKPLLPISLVYSYPNVANELAGTDLKVGTMMKLLRAEQHAAYEFENPRAVDFSIKRNLGNVAKRLVLKGLTTAELIWNGNKLKAQEALKRIQKHQKETDKDANAMEAAKILYGGPNVNKRKLQGAADYLKNWAEKTFWSK